MGAKLYPEVDHMALGQRYCDHVMAMTAEGLHDKSDIAGQLAWRDDRIAAKDAEIAELRLRLDWFGANASCGLSSAGITCPDDGYVNSPQRLLEDIEKLAGERDEARECVGRLCAALSSIERIENRDHGPDWEEIEEARGIAAAALAATPEHLR